MAMGGTVYGTIEAAWGVTHKAMRRHNLRVLRQLPDRDEWPPLIRPMFGITGPSVRQGAYDHDLIHYGATLKGMDGGDARKWIAKFEALLRRLYWYEAIMHIDWIFGPRTFRWVADEDRLSQATRGNSRRVIDRWRFDDGGQPIG